MRRRSRKVAALTIVVSALGLAVGSLALATRTLRVTSHVTIRSTGLTFSGRVRALHGCRQLRPVKLYRTGSDPLLLGATRTNGRGHWRITVAGFAGVTLGHFVARVRRRTESIAGTRYVCKAAASPIIAFSQ